MINLLEIIETLEYAKQVIGDENETTNKPIDKTIQTLRQALSQSEQEPVAWMWKDGSVTTDPDEADGTWTPLYTASPKREWQGLTDEEKSFLKETWFGFKDIDKIIDTVDELLRRRTYD